MAKLQVFDPPMCCSSGVCGPSVDPTLARFAADLEWLKSKGIEVERCNLAQDPGAFVHNPTLKMALNSKGIECLPLLSLDGGDHHLRRVPNSGGACPPHRCAIRAGPGDQVAENRPCWHRRQARGNEGRQL